MITISVPVSRPYPVCIGKGRLKDLGRHLAAIHEPCTVAIVSDTTVLPLYGETVAESLRSAGFTVVSYAIPSGESYKNLQTYGEVLTFLAQNRLTRTDLIVALGGGVVGDLAGFAAATYLRGIDYVQVPTTLLSAVDSSVGGKTAVDLTVGKNLVGAFHQPLLVWCDPDTLLTLPGVVRRDGCAEVIKYGLLGDAAFFAALRETPVKKQLEEVIARCVEMKRDTVNADEFDRGCRQLLNLGHTFGHAIESVSGYTLSHGYCVAIGMALMTRAAATLGYCAPSVCEAVESLLTQYGLPTENPYSLDALSAAVLADKKMDGASIHIAVPYAIGDTRLVKIGASELRSWLTAGGVQ
jgi:3-dehydroquinate synthase